MMIPSLKVLPVPPAGRTGWPWTEETPALPATMPNDKAWPRISIVTPSFNQGQFIEETIRSILLQGYPDLEYIIIDGGSTDESVEIIKKYEPWLTYWVSEKDRGQAHAINKGMSKATGNVLCWLNSDDTYLPAVIQHVSAQINIEIPQLLFGNCSHYVESTARNYGSDVVECHKKRNIILCDYIIQPSSFWTRKAWAETGVLDETLKYSFDWDWFIRARNANVGFHPEDKYLSMYRIHDSHKTGTGGKERILELSHVYETHVGLIAARLFREHQARKSQIRMTRKWIRRLFLSKWEYPILSFLLPDMRSLSKEEAYDILAMG
ncbi:MAG: glycosyltransferase family 2 protein [Abditibacteriaceae bacterium]